MRVMKLMSISSINIRTIDTLVARQMKTIQYSLASVKYMEEGWTVKPKTPVPEEPSTNEEMFHIDFNINLVQVSP